MAIGLAHLIRQLMMWLYCHTLHPQSALGDHILYRHFSSTFVISHRHWRFSYNISELYPRLKVLPLHAGK